MAYDYIERTYGIKFKQGTRVLFTEYGNMPGTVKRVNGDPHYVTVKFANGKKGLCHPTSLIIVGSPSGVNQRKEGDAP